MTEQRLTPERFADFERQRETLHLLVDYYIETVIRAGGDEPLPPLQHAVIALAAHIDGYIDAVVRDVTTADLWIGRRLLDYTSGPPPADAVQAPCTHCGTAIALTPRDPQAAVTPPVCLQCCWEVTDRDEDDEDREDA